MNRSSLREMLRRHEGLELKPYRCPAGALTIGIGRNLDATGISEDEAIYLCDNDITRVVLMLPSVVQSFGALDTPRQHVLVDMAVNLGIDGLRHFVKLRKAIDARDFATAAREMRASKWATQVGDRAVELEAMMKGNG